MLNSRSAKWPEGLSNSSGLVGKNLTFSTFASVEAELDSGLESRLPWQAPSNYHDDHHRYFHVNFGQHLTWWDRMHGTLRRKGRSYGVEVFGGRGAAGDEAASGANDFVSY